MKNKLVAGIAMSAMLLGTLVATPAQSQHRDDRWGVDSNRNSPYYGRQVGYPSYGHDRHDHRSKNNNDALVAGVAGLIIGGMIVGAAQKQQQPAQQPYQTYPEPQYPVYVPQTYCRDVPVRNAYGNIVAYQRACWQQ